MDINTIYNKYFKINKSAYSYKLEYSKWSLTIILSIFIYLIFAKLIVIFYKPDTTNVINYVSDTFLTYFPNGMEVFKPEPVEKLLYISAIICFSFSLYILYYYINKITLKIAFFDHKYISPNAIYLIALIFTLGLIIYVGYYGFMSPNPSYNANLKDCTVG